MLSIKWKSYQALNPLHQEACGHKAFAQWLQHVEVFFKPAGWHHAKKNLIVLKHTAIHYFNTDLIISNRMIESTPHGDGKPGAK